MKHTMHQSCKRCGVPFSAETFYHKGNILMHCSLCRSELRQLKQQEMKRLLELEQELS